MVTIGVGDVWCVVTIGVGMCGDYWCGDVWCVVCGDYWCGDVWCVVTIGVEGCVVCGVW